MTDFRHIVILTGAGISAESGLATFRDKDGIWSKYDYREVATPEGFAPTLSACTNSTISGARPAPSVSPNAGALRPRQARARAQRRSVLVVTQNIDPLHEAAGARNLIHMHGEHLKALCANAARHHAWRPTWR